MNLVVTQSLGAALALAIGTASIAQEAATKYAPAKPRTITRLFWQDSDSNSVRWSNLQKGTAWTVKASSIAAFPKLDKEQCSLVQMEETDGVLLTGVHDHEDGTVHSGWVAIDSGVEQEPHGDHFHWRFNNEPRMKTAKLDTAQGNPAHVYLYDSKFYLANDKKDGFTIVDPKALQAGKAADRFYSGGGGHITMAAVNNQVCYSTWIDREGDKKGQVDVVPLASGSAHTGYSFQLPSGGIHGATANSGKVFFAPTDGVCWVDADLKLEKNASKVVVNHLSLGKDATDKPLRTGAFANHMNWVLFVIGTGEQAQLCMIDAKSPKPTVLKFLLGLTEGTSATTPTAVKAANGKHYAFVFQESKDGKQAEKLLAIELDANGDGNFRDAAIAKTIEVGASKIEGHGGHHEIAFTPSRRFAMLTNPGSGSIWVIAIADLAIQAKLSVGGTPTRVIAVGG